jgi:hypothetical protein
MQTKTTHRNRRWITLALMVLTTGFTTPQAGIADNPPNPFNPLYSRYNKRLAFLYQEEKIGYETVRRLWLGAKPDQDDLFFIILINTLLHQLGGATESVRSPALKPSDVTGSYSLSSSTPVLPFVGNQMVVPGAVLFANNTNLSAVTFRRQGDCSLVEDIFEPVNNRLTPDSSVELPGAQDYLHMLSGLTTTPDVFPNGCADATFGTTSVFQVAPIGVTANGLKMVASLSDFGLSVSEMASDASTVSTVMLVRGELRAFAVADVNGDGLNDIVASGVNDPATQQPSLATFLNNGDGTFSKPSYVDTPGSILFTVDDVNGDGHPDVVMVNDAQFDFTTFQQTRSVTTFAGNGDGTFQPGVTSATAAMGTSMVITGDFNGDGRDDLLIGDTLMLGNGDGTFKAGPPLPAGVQYEAGLSVSAAVGDLNHDGSLDVVYSGPPTGSGIVQILLGKGDGTFQVGARYASLTQQQPVTVTDIDGDGNLDIMVGNGQQGLYVQDSDDKLAPMMQFLLGRGDGTFVGAPVYTQKPITTFANGDFNGDGNSDVLAYSVNNNGPGSLIVLPGDGAGNLGTAINSAVKVAPATIVAADMNGDGKPDAVLAGNSLTGPVVSVLLNQGNGTFAGEHDYALPGSPASLTTGDFNGDGIMDVAVGVGGSNGGGSGASGVYVLLGQRDGTLTAPVKIDSSLDPVSLAVRDLNGDGRTDLVIADQGFFAPGGGQVNGALHIYLGNADGTFTTAAAPSTSATNYSLVALGDLNGDGNPDLIVAGNVAGTTIGIGTPNIYTLLGNGDGTFQPAHTNSLAGKDGIGAQSITLADFNGDGKLDVVIGNSNDFVEVLLGYGDGTFGNAILTLGQQPQALGSADLNGDGLPELLMGSAGGLAVFQNIASWPALN